MSQPAHETYLRAMQAALRLLRAKERTEAELQSSLSTKGFKEPEVGLVLKSLKDRRYVDDSRVADRAVEIARTTKPKPRLRVEAELKRRGTDEDAIESALVALGAEGDLERAEKALEARRKPTDTPAKSAAFLARQGFDEETVRTVVERSYGDLE